MTPAAPHQHFADNVRDHIDGGLQGDVDLAHCRDGYADADFFLLRLRQLFSPDTPEAFRNGYCRTLQKHIERGGR